MITNSLHILLPALLLLLFRFAYKAAGKRMGKFYVSMTCRQCWRKFYTLAMLLVLLLFHFNYANITPSVYDLAPSSVALIFLFSHRFTERIIYFLQNRKTFFVSAIITMACLFVPHFFSTTVTMGILLFGAVFYPSRKVCERILFPDYRKEIIEQPDKIIFHYYKWND